MDPAVCGERVARERGRSPSGSRQRALVPLSRFFRGKVAVAPERKRLSPTFEPVSRRTPAFSSSCS